MSAGLLEASFASPLSPPYGLRARFPRALAPRVPGSPLSLRPFAPLQEIQHHILSSGVAGASGSPVSRGSFVLPGFAKLPPYFTFPLYELRSRAGVER